jgi:hypothetical protein
MCPTPPSESCRERGTGDSADESPFDERSAGSRPQGGHRVPIWDFPGQTRCGTRGPPPSVNFAEFFDLDKIARIESTTRPAIRSRSRRTDQYKVYTTKWGAVKKFKQADTPGSGHRHHAGKWEKRSGATPTDDRIAGLARANYRNWRDEGYWIDAARLQFDGAR